MTPTLSFALGAAALPAGLLAGYAVWTRARSAYPMASVVALAAAAILLRYSVRFLHRSGALGAGTIGDALNGFSLALFLAFIVLGWRTVRPRREDLQRARVNELVIFTVLAMASAALLQRHFWPFASWRMTPFMAPTRVGTQADNAQNLRLVGVTADGREYRIDHRAWEPVTEAELIGWLFADFPQLDAEHQDRVAAWMLGQADRARAAVRAGEAPGSFGRVFGPLAAPSHFLYARLWRSAADVPAEPFVRIRWYRESYDVMGLWRGADSVALHLEFAYPRTP